MYQYRMFFLLAWLAFAAAPTHALDGGVESLRQTGKAFAAVARQVSPSVVFIQKESKQESPVTTPLPKEWPFGDDLFRRFFGDQLPGAPRREAPQERRRAVGQSSGFVFSSKERLLSDKTYILRHNAGSPAPASMMQTSTLPN